MLYEKIARWFIALGCLAAVSLGFIGLTAAWTTWGSFRESTLAYYSLVGGLLFLSLLSLGLAYGIYRASRLCAITTTVLFLTGMMRGHFSKAETAYWWPLMLTFGSLYLLGVIGCFAWHARGRDSAYTLERSLPTAQRKD